MRTLSLALCLILLLVGVEPALASSGIQLIGGCDTPGEAFSVAVCGDYAYVADGDAGLRVISVADPAHPAEVGHCDTPGWARGVAVSGNFVYVADYDSGLRVISVIDPADPVEVGSYRSPGWTWGVAARGNYVYIACDTAGLRVISVADPEHPSEVGHCHPGSPRGVCVRGDSVYVAGYEGSFTIVSVVDPAYPASVGGYFVFHASACGVAVDGEHAYVTFRSLGLHIVSVPSQVLVGQCGAYMWDWGVAVSRDYAYVAADEDGLWVISVADPTNPTAVGFYDEPNWWANGVTVAGGHVYVAYGGAGLQVFQVLSGVGESSKPHAAGRKPTGTVTRSVLLLPETSNRMPQAASLQNASGRKVLDLHPGAHDVTQLAPGVYFIHESQAHVQPQAIRKVIIAR
ncbi:hypothetical protein FJY68_12125 [candidate division WOR-3 bacterium]|uniref:YncE family protein n=1 Tax=candidate division WOR-3 bacterium TaxID=2052148 RepID=A0A937XJ58_UNCW3|nr:hypothetical protein [candidate division WOR-3 bacterium]